jgi:hypothetical protein
MGKCRFRWRPVGAADDFPANFPCKPGGTDNKSGVSNASRWIGCERVRSK